MKKIFLLSAFFVIFLTNSCTKRATLSSTQNRLSVSELTQRRDAISLQIKKQFDTTKTLFFQTAVTVLPGKPILQSIGASSVSGTTKKAVKFNARPIKDYYYSYFNIINAQRTTNSVNISKTSVNMLVDSADVYTITADDYDPNVGEGFSVYNEPNTSPIAEQLGYINQYFLITNGYTDLDSYLDQLNNLENTIYNDASISDSGKISLTYQIEMLKGYANDLTYNAGYYESLVGVSDPNTTAESINNSSKQIQKARGGCNIDVRSALTAGVIGGFVSGTGAAYAAATAGTVTLPIIGTVTGGVSGFMGGFAVGFVGGVLQSVVGSLLNTCFQ